MEIVDIDAFMQDSEGHGDIEQTCSEPASRLYPKAVDLIKPEAEEDPATLSRGMTSDAKNLYPTELDRNGQCNWTDKYPEDINEAAENEETASSHFWSEI